MSTSAALTPAAGQDGAADLASAGRPGLAGRIARRFRERWPQVRRTLPRDLAILLIVYVVTRPFSVSWVMTDSVHTSLALVIKGATPAPGELVVFSYAGGPIPNYYLATPTTRIMRSVGLKPVLDGPRKGDGFLKYLVGVPGDRIEVEGRKVFLQTVRGRLAVGEAKPATRTGVPLEVVKPQVIPQGYVYVWSPHVDALDSRYTVMGLVPVASIVGKGVALW